MRLDVCLAAAAIVAALAAVKYGSSASSEAARRVLFPAGGTGVKFPRGQFPISAKVLRLPKPPALSVSASPTPWPAISTAVATTIPLAWRRLAPLAAFWVSLAATMASTNATVITFVAVVLAAYSAVVYSRFRGLAVLSLPLAGVIITAAFKNTAPPLPGRMTALVLLVAIMLVGNTVHVWKQRAGDSQARMGRLQAEHQAETLRALELERARIAGELHDVVTHNVSMMVVQAGAARQVLGASPDEARSALLAVESSGRAALTELQHLLGLLVPPGDPTASGESGTADAEPPRPQPGLDRLRPLIDRVTAAGLPVELRVSGAQRALPPGLDLAAYRVVQEALTNVVKHAGRAKTLVALDYRASELVIEISDEGPPGAVAEPESSGAGPGRPGTMPGARRGLLGLRERVWLYGGDFDAGRRPGGGWRVRARFPAEQPSAGTMAGAAAMAGLPSTVPP
jgi:signal transduction histidine kinase